MKKKKKIQSKECYRYIHTIAKNNYNINKYDGEDVK